MRVRKVANQEYGGALTMHSIASTGSETRGTVPILYVEAPASGLWEARVSVCVTSAEVSAGLTVLDRDGIMPDLFLGFDSFTSRGFASSSGVVALRYGSEGFSGTVASQDVAETWMTLKLVRTGSGRYDLWYSPGLASAAWQAPDDARNSNAGERPRLFVKTSGMPGERLFSETEWLPLAQQVVSAAGRRIGLYLITGDVSREAKFKDFLVRDLFPESVASFSLDDGQLRENLEASGMLVSQASVSGRDGYSQGALLFDGNGLAIPLDPLLRDASTNASVHEFTVSLWVKPYSLGSGGILGRRLAQHLPDLQISPSISMTPEGGVAWSMLDETGQNFTNVYQIPTSRPYAPVLPTSASTSLGQVFEVNEWVHIAFVKEADTVLFYRNGKRFGFASLAPDVQMSDSDGVPLLNFLQDLPFHGALDDVRFFDVGLADFAIAHLFGDADLDTLRGKTQRCMAGSNCVLTGVTGQGLSDLSTYAVLSQCGRTAVSGFPGLGISDNTTGGSQVISWGHTSGLPLTASGGRYQLCWCGANCAAPEDFRVLVGTLVVVGPYTGQARTCTLGQVATFDLQGLELDAGDKARGSRNWGEPMKPSKRVASFLKSPKNKSTIARPFR